MDPKRVRFSQSSILYGFRDGRSIDGTGPGTSRTGKIEPSNVPPLSPHGNAIGQLFTLDNRRLEAFLRRADKEIPWRWAHRRTKIAQESFKFTTTNDGVSVRGERRELT